MAKPRIITGTNQRKARCQAWKKRFNPATGEVEKVRCNKPLLIGEGIYYDKSKSDCGYYCPDCFNHIEYSNNEISKKQNSNSEKVEAKHGWKFGIEVEENRRDTRYPLILMRSHFIKSLDCSVENEYISPIEPNANGIGKMLTNLLSQGFYQDNRCGCHLNLSNSNYNLASYREYVVANYDAIFGKLYHAMMNNPDAMKRLYGRALNGYCGSLDASDKFSFINVLKLEYGVLEFRFPKLVDSKRYMQTLKVCKLYYKAVYDGINKRLRNDVIAEQLYQIFINDMYSR